jgi:hypothetical protein
MARNTRVAAAEGRLSLARARRKARIDFKRRAMFRNPQVRPAHFCQSEAKKENQKSRTGPTLRDKTTGPDANMLWLASLKTPSNCVFFACNPRTLAVLTS